MSKFEIVPELNGHQQIVLGQPSDVVIKLDGPLFGGKRFRINAPSPNFLYVTSIIVGDKELLIDGSLEDAFTFNPNAFGIELDLPESDTATIIGKYTGYTPRGYVPGDTYLLLARVS